MSRGRRLLLEDRVPSRLVVVVYFTGVREVADALGSMTRSWTRVADVGTCRGRREAVVTSWERG